MTIYTELALWQKNLNNKKQKEEMREQQKQAIIESGKQYFRSIIIPNHLKNLKKLKLSGFDVNPFLINYLAAFLVATPSRPALQRRWFIRVFLAQV